MDLLRPIEGGPQIGPTTSKKPEKKEKEPLLKKEVEILKTSPSATSPVTNTKASPKETAKIERQIAAQAVGEGQKKVESKLKKIDKLRNTILGG